MKRLIVYFHYDPLGQIDTACRVAVEAMAHYGEVFFISNGTLRPAEPCLGGVGDIDLPRTGK